jgi:hypothetical protein
MIAARNSGVRHTPPMATTHRLDEDRAVEAASAALRECDHSRLPAWMVARIAVECAREVFNSEMSAMQAELAELRRASALAGA